MWLRRIHPRPGRLVSWLDEESLTPGHRAALARARKISSARAREAAFVRHGCELPTELVETLQRLTGPHPSIWDAREQKNR